MNQQPLVHQLRMRPFKPFWDEPKAHPPLPKVFGVPTYLTSFCAHSTVRAWESLKREGKRAKVATINGKVEVTNRSKKAKVATRTTHLKRELEVKGQSESLKVNSLPFLHYFLLFSCVVLL
jgi:hypothetical protein